MHKCLVNFSHSLPEIKHAGNKNYYSSIVANHSDMIKNIYQRDLQWILDLEMITCKHKQHKLKGIHISTLAGLGDREASTYSFWLGNRKKGNKKVYGWRDANPFYVIQTRLSRLSSYFIGYRGVSKTRPASSNKGLCVLHISFKVPYIVAEKTISYCWMKQIKRAHSKTVF